MTRISSGDIKPVYPLPSFLQSRQEYASEGFEQDWKCKIQMFQEYEKIQVVGKEHKINMKLRAAGWVKNTPRVLIGEEKNDILEVWVQNPKNIRFNSEQSKVEKLEKIQQILSALFRLADIYGYFYCDPMMIRYSITGSPVVWINKKFQQSERELPIRNSSVSQLIFIQKIKQILSNVIQLPRNIQLTTKNQLSTFVSFQKSKLLKQQPPLQYINSPSHHNNQEKSESQGSNNKPSKEIFHKNSQTKKNSGQTVFLDVNYLSKGENFLRTKKGSPWHSNKADRNKTEKFFDLKHEKSEKQISRFLMVEENNKNEKQPNNKAGQKRIKIRYFVKQAENAQNEKKSDEKKKRHRKNSMTSITAWWTPNEKKPEHSFPNSTFSTGISVRSINGDAEQQIPEQKQIKVQSKEQNKVSIARKKLTENIRKIMKQSGIRISEEDTLQLQMGNLLNQVDEELTSSFHQSTLILQFDRLFESSFKKIDASQLDISQEFNNLLN